MLLCKRYSLKITLFAILIASLSITGCAKKKGAERVIATINDYEMTIEDFNYESKEILNMGIMLGDFPVTKEDVLEALITKEILLQKAQEEGLDKNKDFIKAIELYWEQTLLKNLLMKKSKEIARKTPVYESEINDYYDRMKTKLRATVFVFADEKAARRAFNYKGDIHEYVQQNSEKISFVYTIPSKWYILGEGYPPLTYDIFNIGEGNDKGLIRVDDRWGLALIEEKTPNEIEPLSVLREEVMDNIKNRKEKEMMDEWIDVLRAKAKVKINQKVFNTLR